MCRHFVRVRMCVCVCEYQNAQNACRVMQMSLNKKIHLAHKSIHHLKHYAKLQHAQDAEKSESFQHDFLHLVNNSMFDMKSFKYFMQM